MADITKSIGTDCGERGERGERGKRGKRGHTGPPGPAPSPGCTNHPDMAAINALNTDLTYWPLDLQQHCIFFEFALAGSMTLQAACTAQVAAWGAFLATPEPRDPAAARALAVATNTLFQTIYNTQIGPNGWVGWLYPSVTAHCIEEGQYFVDALDGMTWTPQQLRDIWLGWNADHAINISHFIDPQEFPAVATATGHHQTFEAEQTRASLQDVGCDCTLDGQAIETGTNFNAFLDSLHVGAGLPTEVLSVLIPLVVVHIKAETDMANAILALLNCGP